MSLRTGFEYFSITRARKIMYRRTSESLRYGEIDTQSAVCEV
ncbi:hypothetical protein P405_04130 [Streptomyces sp. FR-008]|nr:hypothetical protein P405_04130 [Streptomyces sp. FR-008]